MTKNLLLLVCFGYFSSINSQIIVTDSSLHKINDEARADEGYIDFNDKDSYIGSPFENPEFQKSQIFIGDSLLRDDLVLRYNVVSNVIEIKDNVTETAEDVRYLAKSDNLYAIIKNKKIVFVPLDGSIENGSYFEVTYEGSQVDMYKKHEREIRPVTKASTSFTKELPPVFRDKPLYFLVTKRKKFYQFPKQRNAKFQVFGAKADAMKQYAKKEKLNVNKESDLIEVVKHFESL